MLDLKLMGVMNFTPNSFSDGNLYQDQNFLKSQFSLFEKIPIIDFGAESTAPSNAPVSAEIELSRFQPFLDTIFSLKQVVSIDSYHPETISFFQDEWIKRGLKNPLVWNDVSGKIDDDVERFMARGAQFRYVYCHNLAPRRSLSSSHMDYLCAEEGEAFIEELITYLAKGRRERFILDPCLGFSKTLEQNWNILENFQLLQDKLQHPQWLIGFSRKSFLRKKYRLSNELSDRHKLDDVHLQEFLRLSQSWRGEVWLRTHRPELLSLSL